MCFFNTLLSVVQLILDSYFHSQMVPKLEEYSVGLFTILAHGKSMSEMAQSLRCTVRGKVICHVYQNKQSALGFNQLSTLAER